MRIRTFNTPKRYGGSPSGTSACTSLAERRGEFRLHPAILDVSSPASHRAALRPLGPSAEQLHYPPPRHCPIIDADWLLFLVHTLEAQFNARIFAPLRPLKCTV